jgi:integrase
VPLAKLKAAELDRFYQQLRIRGGAEGRPLSPATIRRIHGIIHRALGQGVRWGWLTSNPASSASPPRVPTPDITPPSPSQLAELLSLAAERNPDLTTFLVLAAATGARRSEVLALRWTDVDFDRGTLTIARGIVLGPDGIVEKDTKTHQVRRVALDPTTIVVLVNHRQLCVDRAAAASCALPDDGFLFGQEVDGSRPWRPDSVTLSFARLCRRAGVKGVRLHDLRHYVATRLLAGGVDARTVAGRLGHRNAATTLNVYAHFLAEADRDAAEMLGRLLENARLSVPAAAATELMDS